MLRCFIHSLAIVFLTASLLHSAETLPPIPPIKRLLPPEGVKLPEAEVQKLESRLAAIEKRLQPFRDKNPPSFELQSARTDDFTADIAIFTKAVRFALDLHEFYDAKKDVAKAHKLLDEAERRLTGLEAGTHSWTDPKGLVVLGYRSQIDDSVQPYGVVYPENFHPKKQPNIPVYVWLHGRGDKATDMHFINERMTQIGQLGAVNAIVIHPFGRQCVGFKSAGERDVLDVFFDFYDRSGLLEQAEINRTLKFPVLVGFSMGGAGTWLIGSHSASQFQAVAPGAGFAETAQYTKTDPTTVPWYERKLWGCNDVPCYTRNLFNTKVIAYSGENDKQIQAAKVMEEAFAQEGRKLKHLIGPDVGHQYEPKVLAELKRELNEIANSKQAAMNVAICRERTYFQTRTLAYSQGIDATLFGLEKHWEDSRLDTKFNSQKGTLEVATKNVSAFGLQTGEGEAVKIYQSLIIDGQTFKPPRQPNGFVTRGSKYEKDYFEKEKGIWNRVDTLKEGQKRPQCQGPIDDAFLNRFLVVAPSGKSNNPLVQRWVEFELQHFIERWRSLMRGDAQIKKDTEVTPFEIRSRNLICFGDPDSNQIIRRAMKQIPVTWKEGKIVAGSQSWSAENHLPVCIYPNPLTPPDASEAPGYRPFRGRIPYLVINSGLTFREAHDKTNSQQNPKLPDWAVLDLTQLPDDKSPGKVVKAGFFDENWQYQEPPQDEP